MTTILNYQNSATRLVMKPGAVEDLRGRLQAIGVTRVMAVLGPRTASSALWARLELLLGDLLAAVCDKVVPHSSTLVVNAAAQQAITAEVDGFLAVGGGSAADTARAIAMVVAEGGRVEDHRPVFTPPRGNRPKPLLASKLPVAAIPLTASAAEVTPSFGVTDEAREKIVFRDDKLACRLIIIDPEILSDVPAMLLATTAMNGLAHAIEGHYSRNGNSISSALALHSMRLFADSLPVLAASPEDRDNRGAVMLAAHISGMVLSNVRMTIHHLTCHALGSLGGLAHGVANSILLPHAMAFNRTAAANRLAETALAMGVNGHGLSTQARADAAIDTVRGLQAALSVPTRLRDVVFDPALIPAIAEHAFLAPGMAFNPQPADSPKPIIAMLEAAW